MAERVYIAASFEQREQAKQLIDRVVNAGHEITEDWTTHKEIKTLETEEEKNTLLKEYVIADTEGVKTSSVYALLLSDRKSTGAHIEFGIALGAEVKHICLIGVVDPNQLFYQHPNVIHLGNHDEFMEYINSL